jgi:hypothetical protein
MDTTLLTPREVDLLLRYPAGRTARLARAGKIHAITLPDGELRIAQKTVERLLKPTTEAHSTHEEVSRA